MSQQQRDPLVEAALAIIHQRDYRAEHGRFDETTFHPDHEATGQCFDDWAADILSAVLSQAPPPAPEPQLKPFTVYLTGISTAVVKIMAVDIDDADRQSQKLDPEPDPGSTSWEVQQIDEGHDDD